MLNLEMASIGPKMKNAASREDNLASARKYLKKALSIIARALGVDHPDYADFLVELPWNFRDVHKK